MVKKRVGKKSSVKKLDRKSTRDLKTDLIILVGIIAIFALIIMFLNFPR